MNIHFMLIYDNSAWSDIQFQIVDGRFHLHFVILHIGFCFGFSKAERP